MDLPLLPGAAPGTHASTEGTLARLGARLLCRAALLCLAVGVVAKRLGGTSDDSGTGTVAHSDRAQRALPTNMIAGRTMIIHDYLGFDYDYPGFVIAET